MIVPLTIRAGCPVVGDHVGDRIAVRVAGHSARDERCARMLAGGVVDHLRQGCLAAVVEIDGDAEVTMRTAGGITLALDLPGRQTAEQKQEFSRAILSGACTGYLIAGPVEDAA